MRLIDADALKKAVSDSYSDLFRGKTLEFGLEGIMAGLAMTSALIDSAETIDAPEANAVPVIRCKDCRWFGKIGCAIEIVDETDRPKENDFCSFAERRNNATD